MMFGLAGFTITSENDRAFCGMTFVALVVNGDPPGLTMFVQCCPPSSDRQMPLPGTGGGGVVGKALGALPKMVPTAANRMSLGWLVGLFGSARTVSLLTNDPAGNGDDLVNVVAPSVEVNRLPSWSTA